MESALELLKKFILIRHIWDGCQNGVCRGKKAIEKQ
jgi:hypothetical protein